MSLQVCCPNCRHKASISDAFASRKLTCPECQQQFIAQDHKAPAPPEQPVTMPPGLPMTFNGAGILVPPIVLACTVISIAVIDSIAGDRRYCFTHTWPWSFVCFLSAAIICPLGWYLNHRDDQSADKSETGEPTKKREAKHSFRGIPMEYCGLIIGAFGLLLPLFQLISGEQKVED